MDDHCLDTVNGRSHRPISRSSIPPCQTDSQGDYKTPSRPRAKLTSRLKSPNDLGVSTLSPPSALRLALRNSPGRELPVGEMAIVGLAIDDKEAGEGSMSICDRKDVSDRSSFVDVTDKKMSRSFC